MPTSSCFFGVRGTGGGAGGAASTIGAAATDAEAATAFDDDATRREATNVGCVAYLRKPFAGQILMEAIAQATA